MNNDYVIVGGELYHYGVKGMKWGVRRAEKAKKRYAAGAEHQSQLFSNTAKALKKSLDDGYDSDWDMELDTQTRKAYQHEMKRSIESAKSWMKARDDIMNMDVNLVTAKDINKRFYEEVYRSGVMGR